MNILPENNCEIGSLRLPKNQLWEKSLEVEKLMTIQKNNMIRLYGAEFSENLPARRHFKENMNRISESQKLRR